ncbi:MAG: hypothetical protein NTW25_04310 [Candidatus Kapabacteria bacterium]|nr:hypothetical protein [Candidatus Kapabacteria bacterium]
MFFFLFLSTPFLSSQSTLQIKVSQSIGDDYLQGKVLALDIGVNVDYRKKYYIPLERDSAFVYSTNVKFNLAITGRQFGSDDKTYAYATENYLYGESVLSYPVKWFVDPFISANGSTMIIPQFNLINKQEIMFGKFRDPITSQQNLGLAYKYNRPNIDIVSRLGLSLKQIRAEKFTSQTDDYTTYNIKENYKSEAGMSFRAEARIILDSNVTYKGSVDTFTTYKDPSVWTFKFENEIQIIFLSTLTSTIKFNAYYDEFQAKRIQYVMSTKFGIIASF